MKQIAVALLIGTACAAVSTAVMAASKTPSRKFYVTVQGRMTSTSAAPLAATLTFSGPVQLPAITLPAGTYLFSMAAPNIMRVSSQDGKHVYATFTTARVIRRTNLEQPLVRFERSAADVPPRLMAIYPENASVGFQPLFPTAGQQVNAPVATTGTR